MDDYQPGEGTSWHCLLNFKASTNTCVNITSDECPASLIAVDETGGSVVFKIVTAGNENDMGYKTMDRLH